MTAATTVSIRTPIPAARSAYIHVPFCLHRCGYCDFTLVAGKDHLIGSYLDGLARELEMLGEPREVETLFFGGGTPTHLPAADLAQLLDQVRRWFPLAEGYEWSVEANPHGFDADKMQVLADRGVNRISLGVQSFDPHVLRFLERDHQPEEIDTTRALLRSQFDNISFDLIFGVPGQTLESWRETLRRALALEPQHLSTYGLTFEKGTSFWSRRSKGEIRQLPEELEREMYALAMEELEAAGFVQYEISSFACPGFECRHNQVYWTGLPYYGFGPGAASYLAGCRAVNHRSVTTWLKRIRAGESPVGESEELSPEDRARERIVLVLRRCAGLHRDDFRKQTGYDLDDLAGEVITRHRDAGLLEESEGHLRLTREGRFVADSVIVDFL